MLKNNPSSPDKSQAEVQLKESEETKTKVASGSSLKKPKKSKDK